MRNKLSFKIICLLTACILIVSAAPISAKATTDTVGEAQKLIDGIVGFKLNETGNSIIQNWIDSTLTENAGSSSEWYIIALSQSGDYDFSAYRDALEQYAANNEIRSATSRQKIALALIASGSTDSFISDVMDNSIGQQGIMSWVFGLHLFNNGYVSNVTDAATVKNTILSLQLEDGGWALSGNVGDVDVTAMTIQALAPFYNTDDNIKSAVDKSLSLLSSRQLENGDYSSYGVPCSESTAQVITALSALGIDCASDERFIKNGNDPIDGLCKYKLADGSFSHKQGDASNHTATVQAFYSLVSYIRMINGESGLHILDNRNPGGLVANEPVSEPEPEQSNDDVQEIEPEPEVQQELPKDDVKEDTNQGVITDNKEEITENTVPSENKLPPESEKDEIVEKSEEKTEENKEPDPPVVQEPKTDSDNIKTEAKDNVPAEKEAIVSPSENNKLSYKVYACFAVIAAAAISCIILFILKKRNKKNFIAILIILAVLICLILFVDIQSADDYYNGEEIIKENAIGSVTMTIRCDTIVGKAKSEYIPDDGVILDVTEFVISEGDTAYDILTEAARKYSIQMESVGGADMIYISGINYLYEFDFGDLSGWMYFVNGESPSVGCDTYTLSDGDNIEWIYTCDLGNDLK